MKKKKPQLLRRFSEYVKNTPDSQSLTSVGEDDNLTNARAFADKPLNRFKQFLQNDDSPEGIKLRNTYNTIDDMNRVKQLKLDAANQTKNLRNMESQFQSNIPRSPLDLKPTQNESTSISKLLPRLKAFKSGGDFSSLATIGGGVDALAPTVQPKYNENLLKANPDLQKNVNQLESRNKTQAAIENGVMTLGPYGALIGGVFKSGRLGGQAIQKTGQDEYGRSKGVGGAFTSSLGSSMDVVGRYKNAFSYKNKGTGEAILDTVGGLTGLDLVTGFVNNLTFKKKRLEKRKQALDKQLQQVGEQEAAKLSAGVYGNLPNYSSQYGKKGLKLSKFIK